MPEKSLARALIEEAIKNQSKFLDLGNCRLTDWSHTLRLLENCNFLEILNLGKFYYDEKGNLIKSQNNGGRNQLNTIPTFLPIKLQNLSLTENQIKKIENLDQFQNLTTLNLGGNQIEKIENLDQLRNLTTLNLFSNQISKIENLDKLQNLTTLNLGGNQIKKIENLDQLRNLTTLNLFSNQISKIENLYKLLNLSQLFIGANRISKIENLYKLNDLTLLDLRYNQITRVDKEDLSKNQQLEILDMMQNRIEHIDNLGFLSHLKTLRLRFNYIKNFPEYLHCDDSNEKDDFNCLPLYKAWFEDLEKGQDINKKVKVFFLGNGNVGKSSIVEALKNEQRVCKFCPSSTHGVIQENVPSRVGDITYNLWDFGGQDIYHGTHKLFTESRGLYCIVWDKDTETMANVQDRVTGETIRNFDNSYWLNLVDEYNTENPLLIIQNKVDIHDFENSISVDVIAVSAHTGFQIEELDALMDRFAQELPDYHSVIPSSWLAVRECIEKMQKSGESTYKKYILYDEYLNICRKNKVSDFSTPHLLTYLHNSGTVYYADTFDRKIVIDQKWIIEAIYRLYERGSDLYKLLKDFNRGYCRLERIYSSWGENYSTEDKKLFLEFMLSCGICFPLRNDVFAKNPRDINCIFIFPVYLSDKSEYVNSLRTKLLTNDKVHLRKTFKYLPSQVIYSIISELSEFAELDNIWNSGLLFKTENSFTLLEADFSSNRLDLYFDLNSIKTILATHIVARLEIRSHLKDWTIYSDNLFRELNDHNLNEIIYVYGRDDNKRSGVSEDRKMNYQTTISFSKEDKPLKPARAIHETPLSGFISYSKFDGRLFEEKNWLEKFIRVMTPLINQQKKLIIWNDENLTAGEDWDETIKEKLGESDIIFFLMSTNLLAVRYINDVELVIAKDRKEKGECSVIPIHLSKCPFTEVELFAKSNVIPKKGVAITSYKENPSYHTMEDAWTDVYYEVKNAIEEFKTKIKT